MIEKIGPDGRLSHNADTADIHQLDGVRRADADTGAAPHAVIRMNRIMPCHVQQHDGPHVTKFGTGATMLAQIMIDERAVGRNRILPVRRLELVMRVLKMEQHLEEEYPARTYKNLPCKGA
jgi:hypothetical protein